MTSVLQTVTRIVRENWFTLLVLVGLLAARLLLQTRGTPLASAEEFERRIRAGQPVALYVFNNTWLPCLVAKPVVDRLEKELEGEVEVVRVNVMSELGLTLARRYGVRATPSMLVFDGAGNVVHARAGVPDGGAVRAALAEVTGG